MKKARLYLLLFLASFVGLGAEGQPAYKRPLGLGSAAHLPCTFPITVGVKGFVSDNYMLYDAVKTAINKPSLSTGAGITVEWEYKKDFSVGIPQCRCRFPLSVPYPRAAGDSGARCAVRDGINR